MKDHLRIKVSNGSELTEKILSYRWRQRIRLGDDFFTPGYITEAHWKRSLLPEDLSGKRFLDLGANDGMIAFMAEKRNAASVTAVDMYSNGSRLSDMGISYAKEYLNSRVEIIDSSIYDLHKLNRKFDVVFLGDVLVYLDNPTLAIRQIAAVCQDEFIISDIFWTGHPKGPALKYLEDGNGIYIPNPEFVIRCLRQNGFRTVTAVKTESFASVREIAELFPLVEVKEGTPVYLTPSGKSAQQHVKNTFRTIVTGEFEKRVFLKLLGWVEGDAVRHIEYKNSFLKRALKMATGDTLINLFNNSRFERSTDSASYVITAKK